MTTTTPEARKELSQLERAAYALKHLRAQLDKYREPIAIVGMACRFPGGANDLDSYWRLLCEGRSAVVKVPRDRWDADELYRPDPDPDRFWETYMQYGSFLDHHVDGFDAEFFKISPREAMVMDPQQRLLLEVAWESLEHAGVAPDSLLCSRTGVYVGLITGDYGRIPFEEVVPADLPYYGTGNSVSFPAGRLSFSLGLQGPCMVVDTACSSTLVSTHLACQALRSGECDLAISGGVSLMIFPDTSIILSKMRATAPDGRSKTFDAGADGFGRGEGCGVVVLKRLEDALRDGDKIWALIRGAAVNHDGPSGGITVPNGPAQEKLLKSALESARLRAEEVNYIEAHGTGTPLGDPIELQAIHTVIGQAHTQDQPLLIGSVKTNIGHLEAAAGVAGLIKVALALHHERLPASLNFKTPNPAVPWNDMPLRVVTELTPWARRELPRIAGISSFGLSGINGHVLVQEAPVAAPKRPPERDRPLHLLTLSARTPEALRELSRRYADFLERKQAEVSLADVCFTANTGRSLFEHRLAVTAASSAELCARLKEFTDAGRADDVRSALSGDAPQVAFLFTGQGAQHVSMGRELFETQPSFRATLERCDELLRAELEQPLLSVLYPEPGRPSPIDDTAYAQPALFAIEVALGQLLLSFGVRPAYMMGHSIGEYAAACLAGVFTLEEGLRLVATRGRLMQSLPRDGAMFSVKGDLDRIGAAVVRHAADVAIAAVNGPQHAVISGREEAVHRLVARFEAEGMPCKRLKVSHAFHSPLMTPILDEFARVVEQVHMKPPSIPIVSNLTGRVAGDELLTASYWRQHLLRTVAFADGIASLGREGVHAFVEIGPTPTLSGLGQLCLPQGGKAWLPTLRPGVSDWRMLLDALAELYVAGQRIDWRAFERDYPRNKVQLPTYPWQRRRHWIELPADYEQHRRRRGKAGAKEHPLLGRKLRSATKVQHFESLISSSAPAFLAEHQVYGTPVVPGAAFVEAFLAAGASLLKSEALVLENVAFRSAVSLPDGEPVTLQVLATPREDGGYDMEVHSTDAAAEGDEPWVLRASAQVSRGAAAGEKRDVGALRARCSKEHSPEAFYARVQGLGLDYGPSFRPIRAFWSSGSEVLGRLTLPGGLAAESGAFLFHPVLLDGCFQALGAIFPEQLENDVYLPIAIDRLELYGRPGAEPWVHSTMQAGPGAERTPRCDFEVLDPSGRPTVKIEGLRFQRAKYEALQASLRGGLRRSYYKVEWVNEPLELADERPAAGAGAVEERSWLLLADRSEVVAALAESLRARGDRCVLVHAGSAYEAVSPVKFVIDPRAPEHYGRLLSDLGPRSITGVVHLFGLDQSGAEKLDAAGMSAAWKRSCGSLLHLVQGLAKASQQRSMVLCFVTRGAVAASDGEPLPGIAQAPSWGLGRVIGSEHPELRTLGVDLPPEPMKGEIDALLKELRGRAAGGAEDQVALRPEGRLVPRLARAELQGSPQGVDQLRSDATYLVTGGLGGLGSCVLRRLAEQGARHLLVISRSGASEAHGPLLSELAAMGVTVEVARADVAREAEVQAVFRQLDRAMPPLAGVVHAAGVLDDGILLQQSEQRFAHVMAPKVEGSWILHRLTQDRPLDFFVLFSSAASLLGSAGQGNYVAANAFVDALAHHRRARGLVATSINWGAWAEVGLAAQPEARERVRERRVATLQPAEGLDALTQVLAAAPAQIGVVPIHWNDMQALLRSPFFNNFKRFEPPKAEADAFLKKLDEAPWSERHGLLVEHVTAVVRKILGIGPSRPVAPERGFFDMGMDSMMSVELRNRLQSSLGCSLPATVAFDNPTVNQLVDYLEGSALARGQEEAPVRAAIDDAELGALLEEVDALSGAEINARLQGARLGAAR
uniref:Polyketide synthase n=1 Tax=Sorangium cellulosum TaxID=56 RepID=F1B9Q5_SORCE|nr:polyketide synthase [Sorangium cellulosum]